MSDDDKKRKHPAAWVIGMVVAGLAIVAGGIVTFTLVCDPGASEVGWCSIVAKEFPRWEVLSGLATLPVFIFTWVWREKRARESERKKGIQIEITQDGYVVRRFTTAADRLGSKNPTVRLGALYALERLAADSPRDQWTIKETLSAYVRMSSPFDRVHENKRVSIDVQVALTIIGRHRTRSIKGILYNSGIFGQFNRYNPEPHIDLSDTNLCGASLCRADLYKVNLSGANLSGANLSGATLLSADLTGTVLSSATLTGTSLSYANLTNADFTNANLMNADFTNANLMNANLTKANYSGADLSYCKGLTREQLQSAIIDHNTKLPPEFADLIPPKPDKQ